MIISYFSDECIKDDKSGFLGVLTGSQEVRGLKELVQASLDLHICISTFKDDFRRYSNLISNQLMVFDFDKGEKCSKDIHNQLMELGVAHIILGSKNHMKDKQDGKGIIERFHLFIPLKNKYTLDDKDFWKWCWKKINRELQYASDEACNDMTRYFYKHSKLLFGGGKILLDLDEWRDEYNNWKKIKDAIEKDREEKELKKLQKYGTASLEDIEKALQKIISASESSVEKFGVDQTTFKVACKLAKHGGSISHLQQYNNLKCEPKWSDAQIKHKWDSAKKSTKGSYISKKVIQLIIGA